MIRRQELYDRQCVASLIHVIEQAPLRAAVRRPLAIHRSSVGLLLLWSMLRWERTFLIQTLERLGVDLWSLTRDVDAALALCSKQARETDVTTNSHDLDPLICGWLNRAAEQARTMRHDFLASEHLLLALLADADLQRAAIFQRNGLTYDSLKQAVVDALLGAASSQAVLLDEEAVLAWVGKLDEASSPAEQAAGSPGTAEVRPAYLHGRPPAKPEVSSWIADIDRPAVGVPRRFGVFIMMLMVTLYAFLFSLLKLLRASNLVFVLLALLFTGIGIGQAMMFGGRYPRAASIWTGSILVPIEVCVYVMCQTGSPNVGSLRGCMIYLAIFILCIPFGAVFGYLFGTLTAGGFWLVDRYEKRQQAAKESAAE
ncbi:MAG: Clp protease N-terminal domain-containing protein [Thermoguttaceae bacterium]